MKIHFTGLCEIAATACTRLGHENGKEAPTALSIARHLGGDERAVRKEFEPLIDGIAMALRKGCKDWPETDPPKSLPTNPPDYDPATSPEVCGICKGFGYTEQPLEAGGVITAPCECGAGQTGETEEPPTAPEPKPETAAEKKKRLKAEAKAQAK